MSTKKKIGIFSIILCLIVGIVIGTFKVLEADDVEEKSFVTYQDASYRYKIVEKEDYQEINLTIDSQLEVESIEFPDGSREIYNKKSVKVSYEIQTNGVYLFYVTYRDGSVKVVRITVNSIGNQMEVEDENTTQNINSVENLMSSNSSYKISKLNSIDVSMLNPEGNIIFSKDIKSITNKNVLVSITDNLNGEYQIEYQIDNGTWNVYTSSIVIDKNCKIQARYRSGNVVGNSINFSVDNIDKTSPKIKLNNSSEGASDIVVGIEIEDESNTINYYYWSQESNLEEIPKKKKVLSGQEVSLSGINGDYYLYVMSTDEAGNRTVTRSDLFNINVDGPQITVDVDGTDNYVSSVNVVPTIVDENEPVTTYYAWSKNRKTAEFSEENKVVSGQSISLNSGDGVYFLHLKSIDSYGNETYFKSNIYYMDNTAPEVSLVNTKSGGTTLTLVLAAKDDRSTSFKYYYSLDNVNYVESDNKYKFTGLNRETEYTLYYKVVDEAGNEVYGTTKASTSNCIYDDGVQFAFSYTGSSQSLLSQAGMICAGSYKIQLWGAQGGYRSSSTYGGRGGYAEATLNMYAGADLYVYVGASGYNGGWNGGGTRTNNFLGGGGATDVRTVDTGTDWSDLTGLNSRFLVAGGGGSDGAKNRKGGAGGGTTGQSSTSGYGTGGQGGTQTAGGAGGFNNSGTFGKGGNGLYRAYGYGGAGGGGWYGGGGTYPDGSVDDDRGGGGGSGFALTSSSILPSGYLLSANDYVLTDISLIQGSFSMPSPTGGITYGRDGDGYAIITYLGE